MSLIIIAIIGPYIAPYDHDERIRDENGEIVRAEPPSMDHPLGTTTDGFDVLSNLIIGTQPTIVAGFLGGAILITIGLSIGLVAGYYGNTIDNILMRFTDLMYGVPVIPFAIVLVALLGVSYFTSILIIGMILWRGSARVIRSQTLQIKERPFIQSAKAVGASNTRIIVSHILPNVAPMAILFFAIGTGYTILIMAGLAFLGVTDPFVPSWGIIVRNAYDSGLAGQMWWWSVPPGLLIALTVLALFMIGRSLEADEENNASVGAP